MVTVTTSTLSKPRARQTALDVLEIIILFEKEILKLKFSYPLENAIIELESIQNEVKNKNPLKYAGVVDKQFLLSINKIINFRPSISWNLKQFWESQIDMMDISEKTNKKYDPTKLAMKNKIKILEVNSRYSKTATRFAKNQDDEILLYALFYNHILKTETIEYSFVQEFKDSIEFFGLSKKYDVEEIFSVTGKVQRGWKKVKGKSNKQKQWRTDARAIRDCLGHNAYELDFQKKPWIVHFNSMKKGFEYNKTFNRDSFVKYMNNTDLLYRSSLMLLFCIVALTIIKQHLL